MGVDVLATQLRNQGISNRDIYCVEPDQFGTRMLNQVYVVMYQHRYAAVDVSWNPL